MESFCEIVAVPKACVSSSINLENPTASVSQVTRDIDDATTSYDEQPFAKKIKTASGAAKPSTTNGKTTPGIGKVSAKNDKSKSSADATPNETEIDSSAGASTKKMKAATGAGSSKKSKSVSSGDEAPANKNNATSSAESSVRKPKVLSASAVAGMMLPDHDVMHPTYRPPIRQQSTESEYSILSSNDEDSNARNTSSLSPEPIHPLSLEECISDYESDRSITPTPDMAELAQQWEPKIIKGLPKFVIKAIVNPQGRFRDTPITFTSETKTPPLSFIRQREEKIAAERATEFAKKFSKKGAAAGRKDKKAKANCKNAHRILRGKPEAPASYKIKPERLGWTNYGRVSRTGTLPTRIPGFKVPEKIKSKEVDEPEATALGNTAAFTARATAEAALTELERAELNKELYNADD